MSRCFPYPPPGYTKFGARGGEGSIGSIKLQKENNKTDSERRKEKKRQRKEEKELLRKQADGHLGKIEKLRDEKSLDDSSVCLVNLSDDSSRSGLSEEHDPPVPENHFYLSDGADGSKKRKLDASSPSTAQSGNKIRIRLTFRRPSNPETPIGQEPQCSTSTPAGAGTPVHSQCKTINYRVQEPPSSCVNGKLTRGMVDVKLTRGNDDVKLMTVTDNVKLERGTTNVKLKKGTTSLKLNTGTVDIPAKQKKERPSTESLYETLIEDWAVPPFTAEREDPADQEWLFGTKRQETVPKRLKPEGAVDASRPTKNDDLWPRAHFLPDAEIFALPYTVPF